MSFLTKVSNFIDATQVPQQFHAVDFGGLFTNPYFLVPFIGLLGYLLFTQSFKEMVLVGLGVGLWYFSGTAYINNLWGPDGELDISKVLPVAGGGAVVLGIVIYMYFGRSE